LQSVFKPAGESASYRLISRREADREPGRRY
jgi:hypothetical protein